MTPEQISQLHQRPDFKPPCVLINQVRPAPSRLKLSEIHARRRMARWNARTVVQNEWRPVLSRRSFIAAAFAFSALATVTLSTWNDAYAAYLPSTKPIWNALDYGVTGDGSTNDATAINNLFTNANTAGASVWFPGGRTYELGSTSIACPANLTVVLASTATLRRSSDPGTGGSWSTTYNAYTGAMVSIGDNAHWIGGILSNTANLGTSTSSNSISIANGKTFTVLAGLNIAAGNFIRIESSGTPAAHMEGTVASYVGTTLTFDSLFIGPTTGTFTDWVIYSAGVWQAPMVMHGTTQATAEKVRCTGRWYVGFMLEGWNVPAGSGLECRNSVYRDCWAEAVANRGFYLYGKVNNCVIDRGGVLGSGGITDYGVNFNPANASGTANSQQRNKILGVHVESVGFQGIAISDLALYNIVAMCTVVSLLASAGNGIICQTANTQIPSFNIIDSCTISNCAASGIGFFGTLGAVAQNCTIITCLVGLNVTSSGGNNCAECAGYDMLINNCTTGVNIAASQTNTTVSGRAYGNTTNLADAGTNTVSTQLRVV